MPDAPKSVSQHAIELVYSLYAYPDSPHVQWDYLSSGVHDGSGVYWAAVCVDGLLYAVLRGSVTQQDWQRDFNCWADPFQHADLGPIHPGFYKGLDIVQGELLKLVDAFKMPVVVTGHSLGAGRACILTGMLTVGGHMPAHRICFGEPRPGFEQLAKIIEAVSAISYRNAKPDGDWEQHDFVTDVPFDFWPEQYVHPCPLTDCYGAPAPDDPWGIFKYHHANLYLKAIDSTAAPHA